MTISLDLPDSITEAEAKLFLALKLYELERVSCGKAAEIAGHSKRAFLELMAQYGAPVFNSAAEDLTSDLQNA